MIKELTLIDGSTCQTDDGETAKLIYDVIEKYGLKVGDKVISVLVPHANPHSYDYFCKWAVPVTHKVNMDAVTVAMKDIEECEPLTAGDIGSDIGDLLYWDEKVDKLVRFKSANRIDKDDDVIYIQKDSNVIVEYDE